MKLEMIYLTQSGNTEKLFLGIASKLKMETHLVNLDKSSPEFDADAYLVGFGMNQGTVPLKIMGTLEAIDEKALILVVTCGFETDEQQKNSIERKLLPFINETTDYAGLICVQGEFPESVLQLAEEKCSENPDHPYALKILHDAQLSSGHPDDEDVEQVVEFITETLKL